MAIDTATPPRSDLSLHPEIAFPMNHSTSVALTAASAVLLMIGTVGCADNNKQDTKEVAEELNALKFEDNGRENDAKFLVEAAELSREEISLGKLAQKRSKVRHVRNLGSEMVAEHTISLAALTVLATAKSVSLPTEQTDDSRDAFRKLSDIASAGFDKEYADMAVTEHKNAITVFEKAASESKDAEIKAWATAALPTMRRHLEHSLECQKMCEGK